LAADNPQEGVENEEGENGMQEHATSHIVSTYYKGGRESRDAQPRYYETILRNRSKSIPYKKYGVHSNDVVDVDYFFSPIYYVWISRTTGEPVSERRQQKIEDDLERENDLEYQGIHSTKISYYYWGWIPTRSATKLRNREIQHQITTLNNAWNRLQYSNQATPKIYGVHSSRRLDCLYKHDPESNFWIFKPTGEIIDHSIHLEIERELARKTDLNYLGYEDTFIHCHDGEWEFVTVRNPQEQSTEYNENRRNEKRKMSMNNTYQRKNMENDENRRNEKKKVNTSPIGRGRRGEGGAKDGPTKAHR
jgi:hypothetical protein